MNYMFYCRCKLTNIECFDKWNTSNVENMSWMFKVCSSLKSLNLSNWDTKNVTKMSYMFCNCRNLAEIKLSDKWETGSVTDMSSMFSGCSSLKQLPDGISGWDTKNVIDMRDMFSYCSSLSTQNEITLKVANNCNIDNIHAGCTKDFVEKIIIEKEEGEK